MKGEGLRFYFSVIVVFVFLDCLYLELRVFGGFVIWFLIVVGWCLKVGGFLSNCWVGLLLIWINYL